MKPVIIAIIFVFSLCINCFAADEYLWPIEGYYNISSGFGKRTSGTHRGIDINSYGGKTSIEGADVLAAKDGVAYAVYTVCGHNYAKIASCGCGGGYGNYVFLRHSDGGETRYAHLAAVNIEVGQTVKRGETVGFVGSTGMSTGYHLHFEIRDEKGNVQNPMPQNRDGRHTFLGSSAPKSEAIFYLYGKETNPVRTENGKIFISDMQGAEHAYVAQFGEGRLLEISVYSGTEVLLLSETEKVLVFFWNGLEPVCAPVSVLI